MTVKFAVLFAVCVTPSQTICTREGDMKFRSQVAREVLFVLLLGHSMGHPQERRNVEWLSPVIAAALVSLLYAVHTQEAHKLTAFHGLFLSVQVQLTKHSLLCKTASPPIKKLPTGDIVTAIQLKVNEGPELSPAPAHPSSSCSHNSIITTFDRHADHEKKSWERNDLSSGSIIGGREQGAGSNWVPNEFLNGSITQQRRGWGSAKRKRRASS